jgi:hypothetical protein
MAEVGRPQGVLKQFIDRGAAKWAAHVDVPDENREALRATAVRVLESLACEMFGPARVYIRGWVTEPSTRADRLQRILDAIAEGEPPKAIAARELVSVRWVEKLRRRQYEQAMRTDGG